MRSLLVAVLFLTLTAGAALAQKSIEAVQLDNSNVQRLDLDISGTAACTVGNLNPNYWGYTDYIWGQEGYAFHVYEPDYACCPIGFQLTKVTMIVNFAVADVPSTFQAYVGLAEATWDPTLQCWVPGADLCVSPLYNVGPINTAGTYAVGLPLNGTCACADRDYHYFITFYFTTAFASTKRPQLITDNFPVSCLSYNDWGTGWNDLVGLGTSGNARLYAEVECCTGPVGSDDQTWGGIKGLYR